MAYMLRLPDYSDVLSVENVPLTAHARVQMLKKPQRFNIRLRKRPNGAALRSSTGQQHTASTEAPHGTAGGLHTAGLPASSP